MDNASSPPNDLRTQFHLEYGHSKSYYNFVKGVAQRYKGKLKIVVIENEATADNFWSGDMDEYLMLLATARKAFNDVDPQVKIADSGLASPIWGHLIAYDLLKKGKAEEARDFLKAYLAEYHMPKELPLSIIDNIGNYFQARPVKEIVEEGLYLLPKLKLCVDIVNFHYYEDSRFLSDVVLFIREKTGGELSVMNNELSSRRNDRKGVAMELVKKFAICLANDVRPVLWFPYTRPVLHPVNILPLRDQAKDATYQREPKEAMRAVLRYLNHEIESHEDLSDGALERYRFYLKGFGEVDVLWRNEGQENIKVDAQKYRVKTFLGEDVAIEDGSVMVSSEPLFILSAGYSVIQ